MKVLLLGHRSFVAQGLPEALKAAGHDVTCFSRGPIERRDGVVTGPIDRMWENPHLSDGFDTVVNYIVLKDDGVETNVAFIEALLRFCRERNGPHLIHM